MMGIVLLGSTLLNIEVSASSNKQNILAKKGQHETYLI